MTTTVATYLAYAVLCVSIAVWVGRTLRRYGSIYLSEGREVNRDLYDSLAHLLVVGFYLVSFGVICFVLRVDRAVADTQAGIETLSFKLGTVLVILGGIHFCVMLALSSARRQANIDAWSTGRIDRSETSGTFPNPEAFE